MKHFLKNVVLVALLFVCVSFIGCGEVKESPDTNLSRNQQTKLSAYLPAIEAHKHTFEITVEDENYNEFFQVITIKNISNQIHKDINLDLILLDKHDNVLTTWLAGTYGIFTSQQTYHIFFEKTDEPIVGGYVVGITFVKWEGANFP